MGELVKATEVGARGIVPTDTTQLMKMAEFVARSGWAPKDMATPEKVFVAMAHGLELGMRPMQALQSVHVINGRPSLGSYTAKALVEASGHLEDYEEFLEGDDDGRIAVAKVKRKDRAPAEIVFAVSDAKRAKLWGKPGPWSQYPDDMLLHKARARAMQRHFPDVLAGMAITEDIQDVEPEYEVRQEAPTVAPTDALETLMGASQ